MPHLATFYWEPVRSPHGAKRNAGASTRISLCFIRATSAITSDDLGWCNVWMLSAEGTEMAGIRARVTGHRKLYIHNTLENAAHFIKSVIEEKIETDKRDGIGFLII
jgi:hypothetical protein